MKKHLIAPKENTRLGFIKYVYISDLQSRDKGPLIYMNIFLANQVLLPDGRLMTVSYYVDAESGFVPTITFEENFIPDFKR